MTDTKKDGPSIFDLPVWLDPELEPKPEKQSKAKSKPKKTTKPPAPPCMASRQWREALRAENYKTVAGRNFESMCDNYHNIKDWPEDW